MNLHEISAFGHKKCAHHPFYIPRRRSVHNSRPEELRCKSVNICILKILSSMPLYIHIDHIGCIWHMKVILAIRETPGPQSQYCSVPTCAQTAVWSYHCKMLKVKCNISNQAPSALFSSIPVIRSDGHCTETKHDASQVQRAKVTATIGIP